MTIERRPEPLNVFGIAAARRLVTADVGFTADSPAPLEWRGGVATAIPAQSEALAGQNTISPALDEFLQVTFSQSAPRFESLGSLSLATAPRFEFLGTLAGVSPGRLEFLAVAGVAAAAAPLEFLDVLRAVTVAAPAESLATAQTAQGAATEFRGSVVAAPPTLVENQAILAENLSGWIEFLINVPALIAPVPLEALPLAQRSSPAPLEFGSPVSFSDRGVPLEFTASSQTDKPGAIEFSAILPAVATVPIEMLATQTVAGAATGEFLATQQVNPLPPLEWFSVTLRDGSTAQLEFAANVLGAEPIPLENLSLAATSLTGANAIAPLEFQGSVAGISGLPAEWLATWAASAMLPLEALPTTQRGAPAPVEFGSPVFFTDRALPLEFSVLFQSAEPAPLESAALLSPAGQLAAIEWLAGIVRPDAPAPVEFISPVLTTNVNIPLEFGGALFIGSAVAPLEWLATNATQRPTYIEWLGLMSEDQPVIMEWLTVAPLSLPYIPLEALASASTVVPALLEWLGIRLASGAASAPVEWGALLPPLNTSVPFETLLSVITGRGVPIEWLGTVSAPIPSLRYGRLRSGGPLDIAQEFAPIDVGEVDDFGFDFSDEVGEAAILSTSWTCRLAAFQPIIDPAPQSHVLGAGPHRVVAVYVADRTIIDAALIIRVGAFSVASIGGFAAASDGATYVLEATANLSDGRSLTLSAPVQVRSTNP